RQRAGGRRSHRPLQGSRRRRVRRVVLRLPVDRLAGAVRFRRDAALRARLTDPSSNGGQMRIGLAVGGPLALVAEAARECEDRGIDALWVAETARTAFIQAAVALQATKRATVGTSIALAFPRSPV